MSLVEHLLRDRTPLELAKMLKVEAEQNAALKEELARLKVENFWLKAESPMYGSAGAYHNGSPETRALIDKAIASADAIFERSRESRDRRKIDMPYQGSGLPERRKDDRRKQPR